MISEAPFVLKRLTMSHEMLPFDCGENDLNEFCTKDSFNYLKELLAVTIKSWMVSNNKTGCRFITVDALKKAVPFYQKNSFLFLGNEERQRYERDLDNPNSNGTYAMYFDLTILISDER